MPFLMPDISKYQGPHTVADFVNAKNAGIGALMFKATEGAGFEFDATYTGNVAAAKGAGVPFGAYHFLHDGAGSSQADFFWSKVKGTGVQFVVLDWEAGSRQTAQDFLQRLKNIVADGVKVGGYFGSWARGHGGTFAGFDFAMVPDYGPSSLPSIYNPDPYPLAAWQYTNGASNGTPWPKSVPGIGNCDVSVVYRPDLLGLGKDPEVAALDDFLDGWRTAHKGDPLPKNANQYVTAGYNFYGQATSLPKPAPASSSLPAHTHDTPAGKTGPVS